MSFCASESEKESFKFLDLATKKLKQFFVTLSKICCLKFANGVKVECEFIFITQDSLSMVLSYLLVLTMAIIFAKFYIWLFFVLCFCFLYFALKSSFPHGSGF